MLLFYFQGLPLKNGVKVPAESPGIPGLLIAVLAFGAHPGNRGAELLLFDEGLDGLRVQREASFEMRLQLRFRRPAPMPPTAKAMDLHQAGSQVSRSPSGIGGFGPSHSVGERERPSSLA